MRISDWSSDVCSSDLCCWISSSSCGSRACVPMKPTVSPGPTCTWKTASCTSLKARPVSVTSHFWMMRRSEEHTSELQSLMRISYAVFCLKKKNQTQINPEHTIANSINHTLHYIKIAN